MSLTQYMRAVAARACGERAFLDIAPALQETGEQLAREMGVKRDLTGQLKDASIFFDLVRKVTGKLTQGQVDSINAILKAGSHWPIAWMAYGLATAWHESRFLPQEEWGHGKGRVYSKPGRWGQSQHGRGFVQLTWDRNYEWADKALGLNGRLLADFDLALDRDIAAQILVRGMEEGAFTGKKLSDYLATIGNHDAYVRARRIINGTDRAELIAGYAGSFEKALKDGGW